MHCQNVVLLLNIAVGGCSSFNAIFLETGDGTLVKFYIVYLHIYHFYFHHHHCYYQYCYYSVVIIIIFFITITIIIIIMFSSSIISAILHVITFLGAITLSLSQDHY